jgi:excisionase family DNA binding protein
METIADFRRWLTSQIKRLTTKPDLAPAILETACLRAATAGLPMLFESGQSVEESAPSVIAYLSRCIAACNQQEPPPAAANLTVAEAAERIGVGLQTMYTLISSGQIGCVRIGRGRGTIRIKEKTLDDFQREGSKVRKNGRVTLDDLRLAL